MVQLNRIATEVSIAPFPLHSKETLPLYISGITWARLLKGALYAQGSTQMVRFNRIGQRCTIPFVFEGLKSAGLGH